MMTEIIREFTAISDNEMMTEIMRELTAIKEAKK